MRFNTKYLILATFFIFSLPFFANAGIIINEIMYDLEGADTDREWIEIFNNGSEPVDLTGWKFFEANTNHALTSVQGGSVIQPNGLAVIVDNSEKFLIDWPGFSGIIFDSSFSLSNTGETLVLKNSEFADIDSVSYNSDMGANGDGKSLQKSGSSWIAAIPTPGAQNSNLAVQPPNEPPSEELELLQTTTVVVWHVEPQIYANAGEDKTIVAGADIEFKGNALGLKKEPLDNARYLWNFGDGTIKEGQNVLHSYKYPAEYIVTLDVSSGKYSASDRAMVKVVPNKISISEATSEFIKLKNGSDITLDISGWFLKGNGILFKIPKNTFINANEEIPISSSVSGINAININSEIFLLYPNGSAAFSYITQKPKIVLSQEAKKPQEESKTEKNDSQQNIIIEPPQAEPVPVQQIASIIDSISEDSLGIGKWLFIVLGIGIITGISMVIIRRRIGSDKNFE